MGGEATRAPGAISLHGPARRHTLAERGLYPDEREVRATCDIPPRQAGSVPDAASMKRSLPHPTAGAPVSSAPAPLPAGAATLGGLVPLVYRELRAIAHRQLGRPGLRDRGATMSTTALVNEAYLKLAAAPDRSWNDRTHFLALAAVAMRQILIDRARARATLKRGGAHAHVTLDEGALAHDDDPEALLALDDALERLAEPAPRLARVVELRFYGGLTDAEIAAVLDVTPRTIQRDWLKARMLLRRALGAD